MSIRSEYTTFHPQRRTSLTLSITFLVSSTSLVKAMGDYMGTSFFQQILEGSLVLCRRRVETLGSRRQRKILSRGVQSPADFDRKDLNDEPLIRHLSLKGKGKATLEDGKFPYSAVAGDDKTAAVPTSEKGVGTFAHPVGTDPDDYLNLTDLATGGKGVSDPGPSEP
ncbi:hypothetical protein ACOSP7_001871 [Xanthoceras sorbifolium]